MPSNSQRDRDRQGRNSPIREQSRRRREDSSSRERNHSRRRGEVEERYDDEDRRERDKDRIRERDRDRHWERDRGRNSERGGTRDSGRAKDMDRDRDRENDRDKDRGSRIEKTTRDKRDKVEDQDHRERKRSKHQNRKDEQQQMSEQQSAPKQTTTRQSEQQALRDEEDRRQAADISIYSVTDNPFHDVNLTSKFNWIKKREKEKRQGMTLEQSLLHDQRRRLDSQQELEKLNQRRIEREREMELREQEANRMMQLNESAQMASWIEKEDDFQLEQVQKRAEIRVKDHRAQPIDLLALHLKWGNPDGMVSKKRKIKNDHLERQNKVNDHEKDFIGLSEESKDNGTAAGAAVDQENEDEDSEDEEEENEEDGGIGLEVDLDEPYIMFDHLSLEETRQLVQDIHMHLALEKNNSRHLEFWRCLNTVAQDTLDTLSKATRSSTTSTHHSQSHLQPTTDRNIKLEVNRLLSGKPIEKLIQLEQSIQTKLASSGPHDPEYWQTMLREVQVWKAKATLRTMHEVVLRNRLDHLRRKQRREGMKVQRELATSIDQSRTNANASSTTTTAQNGSSCMRTGHAERHECVDRDAEGVVEGDVEGEGDKEQDEMIEEYSREMSPVPLTRIHPDDPHVPVLTLEEEWSSLVTARRHILQTRFVPKPNTTTTTTGTSSVGSVVAVAGGITAEDPSSTTATTTSHTLLDGQIDRDALAEQLYRQEMEKSMNNRHYDDDDGAEEAIFDLEAEMSRPSYSWQDKYRPRKPRYFNKVHTGYEWNKYNQTHYDTDNPPPKVVQGYKFNIFYPDLIDKTKAPTYKVIKSNSQDDVVTLLFTAGPPYEDIAFTIVNKQWEHSHKRGFKSTFDRGVLQLHFTLARIHYRK